MLTYNHVFNYNNLQLPYHVHIISSDTTSFIIRVNGLSIGEFKNTIGTKYTFSKTVALPLPLWHLLIVGSKVRYNTALNQAIYANSGIKYIKNALGQWLAINPDTEKYYWSDTIKSRFYFNPFYFSSTFLWKMLFGYVPSGIYVNNLWSDDLARDTFHQIDFLCDETWTGERDFETIPAVELPVFQEDDTGLSLDWQVDHFIEELQDLKDGDIISIDNGSKVLKIEVNNCTTKAEYPTVVSTNRPIVHVPIHFTNPNKVVLYAKTIPRGYQQHVNLSLYNNEISFYISREN